MGSLLKQVVWHSLTGRIWSVVGALTEPKHTQANYYLLPSCTRFFLSTCYAVELRTSIFYFSNC